MGPSIANKSSASRGPRSGFDVFLGATADEELKSKELLDEGFGAGRKSSSFSSSENRLPESCLFRDTCLAGAVTDLGCSTVGGGFTIGGSTANNGPLSSESYRAVRVIIMII